MVDLDRLAGFLAEQSRACGRLGSPMYESLLGLVATAVESAGPVRAVLEPYADAPGPAATGLRLLGCVHRLVLEGRAGDLARHYPSVGGSWSGDGAWPDFLAVLAEHADEIRDGMRRPPQTNEVGRAAGLTGALLRLQGAQPLPVRLHELGASAGLNLRADRFCYLGVGGQWGPADSPVRLDPAWTGARTPVGHPLDVVERVGCDPDPVDPTSGDGRLLLASYVWPDQQDRLRRLQGACRVAAAVPATVHRQRAGDLAAAVALVEGTRTVLWHSLVWQYLDRAEQQAVREQVRRLGAAATDRSPFAHVFLEPWRRQPGSTREFLVVATAWPGGQRHVLGSAPGHGVPVDWDR